MLLNHVLSIVPGFIAFSVDGYPVSFGAHAARPNIERMGGRSPIGRAYSPWFSPPSLHGAAPHAGIGRAVGAFAVTHWPDA